MSSYFNDTFSEYQNKISEEKQKKEIDRAISLLTEIYDCVYVPLELRKNFEEIERVLLKYRP